MLLFNNHHIKQTFGQFLVKSLYLRELRVAVFFLSLLVLSLSLVPCCAFGEVKLAKPGTEKKMDDCCKSCHEEPASQDPCEDNENACDLCSPFFTCGSCIGFTSMSQNLLIKHSYHGNSKNFAFIFDEDISSQYFNKQWQPPKIG